MTAAPPASGPALAGIDTVVLAGGLGTRLRPMVADRPKILAPVGDRPFLDHLLAWLMGQGARRVVFSLGHLADQVEAHLAARRDDFPGLELETVAEPEPLGTGGALAHCRPALRSDPVLVINGDTFLEVDLDSFAAAWPRLAAPAALVTVEVPDAARYGRLELSPDGRVQRFVEKGAPPGPAWINGGIYLLSAGLLERLAGMGRCSLERDLLERLPPGSIATFATRGGFIDIGTPESLAEAPRVLDRAARTRTSLP
jgi:NDP-sugar pyrophosphorylase family protein